MDIFKEKLESLKDKLAVCVVIVFLFLILGLYLISSHIRDMRH